MLCLPDHFCREDAGVHEITVALSLLESACAAARAQDLKRIDALHLRVGALSGIVKDALLFSWDVASEGTLAEGSRLLIEEVPLVVFCAPCNGERAPRPGSGLVCPDCGLPSATIVSGREMQLVSMEVPA